MKYRSLSLLKSLSYFLHKSVILTVFMLWLEESWKDIFVQYKFNRIDPIMFMSLSIDRLKILGFSVTLVGQIGRPICYQQSHRC
jgi:hypothetical protein